MAQRISDEDPEDAAWRTSRRREVHRSRPGTPPGTLTAQPDAKETQVRVLWYGPDGADEAEISPRDDLETLLKPGRKAWIQVNGLADVKLIEALGTRFNIHRLVLEDIVNVNQRPKTETYASHVFVLFRAVVAPDSTTTEQVALVFGEDFLISFHEGPADCLAPLRTRIREGKGRLRTAGADYLAYAVLDVSVDAYFPVFEQLGERLDDLEDAVISRPAPLQIHLIHNLKRRLLLLRRAVWPMRDMANALIRDETPFVKADTRPYLRDCYDHLVQLMDVIETDREIVSTLLEVYLSSQSARMNEIMKVLTIIATIFIPLSFVTGLWGMNFDREASPFNMPELGWAYGYPMALGVMATIAGGLLYFFRRRGWLGDGRNNFRRPPKK